MRRRIENRVVVTCEDVDLTKLSNLEFYIKQGYLFLQYTPEIISEHEMVVTIPLEDAMKLRSTEAQVQLAFVDNTGKPDASKITTLLVEDLLKEAGYGTD